MKNISIAMDDTKARIIEALAVLRGTTAGELIAQNGVGLRKLARVLESYWHQSHL